MSGSLAGEPGEGTALKALLPRQDPGWAAVSPTTASPIAGMKASSYTRALDVRVAGGGVGDDHPAIGMADQDDRPADGLEEVGQGGGVVDQAAQRVRRGVDGVSVALQAPYDGVPAGAVSPRAVL